MGNFWLDYDKNNPAALEPVVQKYALTIGDGKTKDISITHGMGTRVLTVQCYDHRYMNVTVPYSIINPNTIICHFATPPALLSIRVVIIG